MTELVIFDCDGVLVDSEPISNAAISENLSGYGFEISPQDCLSLFVGGTMTGVHQKLLSMGVPLPEDWVEQVYAEIYARLAENTPLVPGVAEVLDELDRIGLDHCVASNGSEQKMQITLGQNGQWRRFRGKVFSAHSLGVAKPDPGLFLAAAKSMGVEVSRCLVVEDSLSGVTAATRAGIRCLGYAPEGEGQKLQDMGAELISDMREVLARL